MRYRVDLMNSLDPSKSCQKSIKDTNEPTIFDILDYCGSESGVCYDDDDDEAEPSVLLCL